jgi:HPt (histidine-containing phosphotransfer) domain-containing protein
VSLDIDIQTKLIAVRLRFHESMEENILELDSLSNALPEHLESTEVMAAIRYRTHRLAGTAPSLGYAAIGDLAGQVEHAVNQWTSCQSLDAEHRVQALLESLLDEMERVLYGLETDLATTSI